MHDDQGAEGIAVTVGVALVEITAVGSDGDPIGSVSQDSGNAGTWDWLFDAIDGPVDSDTVSMIATDVAGATETLNFDLTVNNVAPVVNVDSSIGELVIAVGEPDLSLSG